jgi:hypothetical protein
MASARESPKEMMSQLKALKGLTKGIFIVTGHGYGDSPAIVDLSQWPLVHQQVMRHFVEGVGYLAPRPPHKKEAGATT